MTLPDREVTLFAAGFRDGWLACERAMASAWSPVAERVRRQSGIFDWWQLVEARGERPVGPGEYRAAPRPGDDRTGAQLVADARASWARSTRRSA